ncbi:uncharacterized protein BKA78DRAFT_297852 [Phyllosticta capitalensis]|uniref:uncharacterized protein n=1 Tax=Phyllosticta capitalensis TaxID=121624 RepID=UPI00312F36C1
MAERRGRKEIKDQERSRTESDKDEVEASAGGCSDREQGDKDEVEASEEGCLEKGKVTRTRWRPQQMGARTRDKVTRTRWRPQKKGAWKGQGDKDEVEASEEGCLEKGKVTRTRWRPQKKGAWKRARRQGRGGGLSRRVLGHGILGRDKDEVEASRRRVLGIQERRRRGEQSRLRGWRGSGGGSEADERDDEEG